MLDIIKEIKNVFSKITSKLKIKICCLHHHNPPNKSLKKPALKEISIETTNKSNEACVMHGMHILK